MAGLTDQAGGSADGRQPQLTQARETWEESMLRSMDRLREEILGNTPETIAYRCDVPFRDSHFLCEYWGQTVIISWPDLVAQDTHGEPCSTFDTAMLLYYLHEADGASLSDRWIGFRELPDGAFYNQAFQGYSGDRIARLFTDQFESFVAAAQYLGGWRLPALAEYAFAFHPLPRIRLAIALWPGDDEFPSRASVLFDASASHYMTTDGLALLGAGLARRLERQARSNKG
jgi:hypothetical protein